MNFKTNFLLKMLTLVTLTAVLLGCQSSKVINLHYSDSNKLYVSFDKDLNESVEAVAGDVLMEKVELHQFDAISLPNGVSWDIERYPPQAILISSFENDEFKYFGPVLGGPYKVHFGIRKGGGDSVIMWDGGNYNVGAVEWKRAFHTDPKRPMIGYNVVFDGVEKGTAFFTANHFNFEKSLKPVSQDWHTIEMDLNNSFSVGNHKIKISRIHENKIYYSTSEVTTPETFFEGKKTSLYKCDEPRVLSNLIERLETSKDYYDQFRLFDHRQHVHDSLSDSLAHEKNKGMLSILNAVQIGVNSGLRHAEIHNANAWQDYTNSFNPRSNNYIPSF